MFIVSGKYNTAKVMTNASIDDATMSQIIEMCNLKSLAAKILPLCLIAMPEQVVLSGRP